jgi:hypothetical protein
VSEQMRKDMFDNFCKEMDACPYCNSFGLNYGSVDNDWCDGKPGISQDVDCSVCGAGWTIYYKLDDAYVTVKPMPKGMWDVDDAQ